MPRLRQMFPLDRPHGRWLEDLQFTLVSVELHLPLSGPFPQHEGNVFLIQYLILSCAITMMEPWISGLPLFLPQEIFLSSRKGLWSATTEQVGERRAQTHPAPSLRFPSAKKATRDFVEDNLISKQACLGRGQVEPFSFAQSMEAPGIYMGPSAALPIDHSPFLRWPASCLFTCAFFFKTTCPFCKKLLIFDTHAHTRFLAI